MPTATTTTGTHPRKRACVVGGLVAAGLLLAAQTANVQTANAQTAAPMASGCAAMAERFAADHSLSTQPPPVATPSAPGLSGSSPRDETGAGTGSGAVTPDRLARSGGVIAPPSGGDRAVIDPPAIGSNMPTAPAMRPESSARGDTPPAGSSGSTGPMGGDPMGQAARAAQLESLVTAARAAAREGDEARCMDSLTEAQRLSRTAPGGSGG